MMRLLFGKRFSYFDLLAIVLAAALAAAYTWPPALALLVCLSLASAKIDQRLQRFDNDSPI